MTPELDALLCDKYPKIFRDRNAPMTVTAMCCGVDCGDGWFHILDMLCGAIQKHVDSTKAYSGGNWVSPPQVVADQVKEKFGGLRFYYHGGDEMVSGMVALAEYTSYQTCEECGKPGKPRGGGWTLTLCDEHFADRP